jgi:oligopeptide transport system permease protein
VSAAAPTEPVLTGAPASAPKRGPWRDAWLRMRRNRMAVACGIIFIGIVLFSVVGPWIVGSTWGYTFDKMNVHYGPHGPSWSHWFGTDALGRDLMVRVMEGGRIALLVGLVASLVATVIGVAYGAISGYAGGAVDGVMMRVVDTMYALPFLVLIIAVQSMLSDKVKDPIWKLTLMFMILGATGWLTIARIVRGQVLSLKQREFVEAARAVGAGSGRILFRHIVPNTVGPVIVYATASIPGVMLAEAFLSYLGLGIQPPYSSWGSLLSTGADQMLVYPWMLLAPGVVMALTILSLNFLGDGLRDALDPQTRKV